MHQKVEGPNINKAKSEGTRHGRTREGARVGVSPSPNSGNFGVKFGHFGLKFGQNYRQEMPEYELIFGRFKVKMPESQLKNAQISYDSYDN